MPDVNVLVYAFRRDTEQYEAYAAWLVHALARSEIGLVGTVVLGLVRIVTDPRIVPDPAPTPLALQFVDALTSAPRARWLAPTPATWQRLLDIAEGDRHVRGALLPDAWIAALALSHGGRVATADRGFARFEGLDWFVPVGRPD